MITWGWPILTLGALVACGRASHGGPGEVMADEGGAQSSSAGQRALGGATTGGSGGLATGDGGQGVAGGATGIGGDGTSSSSGSGGRVTSAAGASGGPYTLGPDPLPVGEPAGAVQTSSSYLAFTRYDANTNRYELMFLDLQGNGQPVSIRAAATEDVVHTVSPDRRTYLYVQNDPFPFVAKPGRANDICLNVLTDSGYVPGAVVSGFEQRPGLHTPFGFDQTSRFVVYAQWESPRSFEFIDIARSSRHASLAFTVPLFSSFTWAPKGYLFTYRLDPAPTTSLSRATQKSYIAKLVEGGLSEPQPLPANLGPRHFSADGRRLFYSVQADVADPIAFGFVEPPAAPQQFYVSSGASNYLVSGDFNVEGNGESVLSALAAPGDPPKVIVWRLFSDGTRAPVALSEPLASAGIVLSNGGLAALFSSAEDGTQRVEFMRGTEHFEIVEVAAGDPSGTSLWGSFVGEHLLYVHESFDDSFEHSELHSASLVGSSVVDTVVGNSDRGRGDSCASAFRQPDSRYSYLYRGPTAGVRFIDLALSGPAATRTIDVTEPTATIDACPVCNQAGDRCAYVERTETHSKIFSVHFDSSGPSAPKLMFEADQSLALVAVHLP